MAASKNNYDELSVAAAHQVLIEVTHLLGEYREGIVVVGGWVPELQFTNPIEGHIGSIDVDLALDHRIIKESGYRSIRELLLSRDYRQGDQPYIFYRDVTVNGLVYNVEVDFLAGEYGGTGKSHRTQKILDMQPRKASGCDLAFDDPDWITITGMLPGGALDKVEIPVASIRSFVIMKAHALKGRLKEKDAYDIYFCLLNYPAGLTVLAEEIRAIKNQPKVSQAIEILRDQFLSPDHNGPTFVVDFLEETDADERARIKRDAFERVNFLLDHLY